MLRAGLAERIRDCVVLVCILRGRTGRHLAALPALQRLRLLRLLRGIRLAAEQRVGEALGREELHGARVAGDLVFVLPVEQLAGAEVGQFEDALLVDEDVLRLEVAVDDFLFGVQVVDGRAELVSVGFDLAFGVLVVGSEGRHAFVDQESLWLLLL